MCPRYAQPAYASTIAFQGITLSPAIENLDLQKGQAEAHFDITVTNNTKTSVVLTTSSVDFKSLNDSGGLAFIGNGPGQVAHKYGLASWLDIPTGSIDLAPAQSKKVTVTVENRSDLSPGGHYAAVLFKASGAGTNGSTNHVDINQVVSTLVFVRKIDGARYGVKLQKPNVALSWFHAPTNIDLFFKNTGNIQTTPRGLVTITGPFSREVSRGIINTDSSLLLPDSTRLYRTALFSTGHAWWPGIYHAQASYHYEGSSALLYSNTSFLYVNLWVLIAIIVFVACLVFTASRLMRRYRKRKRSKAKKIDIKID